MITQAAAPCLAKQCAPTDLAIAVVFRVTEGIYGHLTWGEEGARSVQTNWAFLALATVGDVNWVCRDSLFPSYKFSSYRHACFLCPSFFSSHFILLKPVVLEEFVILEAILEVEIYSSVKTNLWFSNS